jgi:hypothetical protein
MLAVCLLFAWWCTHKNMHCARRSISHWFASRKTIYAVRAFRLPHNTDGYRLRLVHHAAAAFCRKVTRYLLLLPASHRQW